MDLFNNVWVKIILATATVLGAFFAGIKLWLDHKEKKRQVKVELCIGPIPKEHQREEKHKRMLVVKALNPGYRTVTLTQTGVFFPNNNQIPLTAGNVPGRFPYDLPEGRDCVMWANPKYIAEELRKQGYSSGRVNLLRFYEDNFDNIYKSSELDFNIDEWGSN